MCYDGKTATYGFEMLNELEHAWVMTVHKSQGSEYRAVVLCIGRAGPMLLTRSVLYTAITRAKSLLIIVGDEGAAYHMIDNQTQTATAVCAPGSAGSAVRYEGGHIPARPALSAAVRILP